MEKVFENILFSSRKEMNLKMKLSGFLFVHLFFLHPAQKFSSSQELQGRIITMFLQTTFPSTFTNGKMNSSWQWVPNVKSGIICSTSFYSVTAVCLALLSMVHSRSKKEVDFWVDSESLDSLHVYAWTLGQEWGRQSLGKVTAVSLGHLKEWLSSSWYEVRKEAAGFV